MDEAGLRAYLKKQRRSPKAIERIIRFSGDFETFLKRQGGSLDNAVPADLEAWMTSDLFEKKLSKTFLWGVRYYYQFTGNRVMMMAASALRSEKITRKPLALSEFLNVKENHIEKLAAIGIKDVAQMRNQGKTPGKRDQLAAKTGLPLESILELVKLADLARIPGVKGIRARLYYDAGFDTLEKLAACDPEKFGRAIAAYVEKSGFEGIPPWPKEAQGAVETARKLRRWIEFD